MGQIIKKKYCKISFTNTSSLAVGSGNNENTDSDIVRNSAGVAYIPGSAVAGICRSFFLKDNGKATMEKYFGFVDISNKVDDGVGSAGSKVIFYDANVVDEDIEKCNISKRDSVALDEYKTSKEGAKFDMEALEPGIRFVTYIEQNIEKVDEETDKDILDAICDKWLSGRVYIGSKTMRGYGELGDVKVLVKEFDMTNPAEVENWLDFDMYDNENWKDGNAYAAKETKNNKIVLSLKQAGGISIRKYTTKVTATGGKSEPDFEQMTVTINSKEYPVIPGTSWAGAFRHRMEELVSEIKKEEYFGHVGKSNKYPDLEARKGDIRFSETILYGAKEKVLSRNAIDRFSGGASNQALFTEKTYYGGTTDLIISFETTPDENLIAAMAATIADLHYGFFAVGGLTSIGRGCFTVEKINGVDILPDKVYEMAVEALKGMEV